MSEVIVFFAGLALIGLGGWAAWSAIQICGKRWWYYPGWAVIMLGSVTAQMAVYYAIGC